MTTSAFDTDRLKRDWQPLDWQQPAPIGGEAARYAHYYGIDFSRRLADVDHGFGYFDAAGYRIACHLWQTASPRATLLLGHGYFDHAGLYRHLIRFLLENHFNVVIFDLPGHGLSSGKPASIADFNDYQQVLRACIERMQDLPRPWHWLSQSTGGAIAMDYLQHTPADQSPFDEIILLAPLVWPVGWRSGQYLHALLRPFIKSLPRRFAINSHDEAFLDFLKNADPLQAKRLSFTWISAWRRWLPGYLAAPPCPHPIHVIQGDSDGTVDWRRNIPAIQQHFPNADLHFIEGGYHQLVNESQALREQITSQLKRWLASKN